MTVDQVIMMLQQHANPQTVQGMARVGMRSANTLGVSIPTLRSMAKDIGRNHPRVIDMILMLLNNVNAVEAGYLCYSKTFSTHWQEVDLFGRTR